MNAFFLTLFLFTVITSYSQEDPNKQRKWIYYGQERSQPIPPDTMKRIVRKEGPDTTFFSNGQPKRIVYLQDGRPIGKYKIFHPIGVLKEIGTFNRNQFTDSLKRFHENGNPEYEAWYNDKGKEHGTVNYFYPNGQLEFTYTANNGTPQEIAHRYYENGDPKEDIEYREDGTEKKHTYFDPLHPLPELDPKCYPPNPEKRGCVTGPRLNPNGYNKIYNEDNELWQEGTFKEGKLWNGNVFIYDADGILLKTEIYEKGVYKMDGQL